MTNKQRTIALNYLPRRAIGILLKYNSFVTIV